MARVLCICRRLSELLRTEAPSPVRSFTSQLRKQPRALSTVPSKELCESKNADCAFWLVLIKRPFPGRSYHSSQSAFSGDPRDPPDTAIPSHSNHQEPIQGSTDPEAAEEFDPEVMLDQVTREMLE